MKCELVYGELTKGKDGWEFTIEPETAVEQCAISYLAGRPQDQVIVRSTRLGIFKREVKDD
ncbi:hypothetical protein LCGC14_1795350 [marine sediment metagenome]|uniref:Uncharacterized protein n=1 Tax=marine sediment metagenome TaxID=412755 RepID=A0A0F9HDX5_9ZZZZ